MIRKMGVFCSASSHIRPIYAQTIASLIRYLAANRIEIIYGGGQLGLMGAVADQMLALGGVVRGVIPEGLFEVERVHPGLTELVAVRDLMERKRRIVEMSDAFLVLPGGVGTLDELLEILTWKHLQIIDKPIVLWNIGNFWTPLMQMLRQMEADKFVAAKLFDEFVMFDDSSELVHYFEQL